MKVFFETKITRVPNLRLFDEILSNIERFQ